MLRFKLMGFLVSLPFSLFPLPLFANPLPQPISPVSQPMLVNSSEAPARRGPTLECCNCLNETKTVSLNTGMVNWTVIWPETTVPRATEMVTNSAWTTTAIPAARWISPTDFPQSPSNYGVHIYETKVDLRNCTIGSSVTINGRFLADNRASVMVNGVAIASTLNAEAPEPLTNRYGFLAGSMGTFSYTIPAGGIHTVTIRVRNSDMATGMIAEVTATRTCKEPPERARP
jgi:hypothetical protein